MSVWRIFFDIDDTLFPSSEFAELARRNSVRAMVDAGLDGKPDEIYQKLQTIINQKGSNYQNHFDDLCNSLQISKPERFVASALVAYHNTKMSIQPYPGVARMLQSLREQGYNLYIASNGTTKKQWDKIIRLRLAMFFDDVFVSEDVGSDKKDDFFQKVVIKGAFQPEECLMAGDREDADIIPAKKVGMFAARIMGRRHGSPETSADFALDNITELPPVLKRL